MINMEQEIWKDVLDYDGLYQVSSMGRVKSLNYHRTGEERILKPGVDGYGYLQVCLCKGRNHKMFTIHRLVCQAFIPNPKNFQEVNHIDENKQNNVVDNLEWCDRSYNVNYGTRNQRDAETKSISVVQLDLQGNFVKRWKGATEAAREGGFYQSDIMNCCKGKRQTHKGYKWQYAINYDKQQ